MGSLVDKCAIMPKVPVVGKKLMSGGVTFCAICYEEEHQVFP